METNRDYKEGIGGFKHFSKMMTYVRCLHKDTVTSFGDGN
jgi:hypothetical protein